MGLVCMDAATSVPQFLRAIYRRSRLGVPGDMDRTCHLDGARCIGSLLQGGVRSCCRSPVLLWFWGRDILDYIAIPLTLLIMAVGFTAWVAHIYPVKFETLLNILFGVANLVLSVLHYCFLYNPIGTVKPSWAEKLG
jgi:hypothetical protein